MLRALAWKEWREQRAVVLAGMAAAFVMPLLVPAMAPLIAVSAPGGLWDVLPVGLALVLWPAFAAAAGAGTLAHEAGDGTLRFLLSRPVGRTQVWLVKVALAAAAGFAVAAWSLLVALGLAWSIGAESSLGQILGRIAPSTFDPFSALSISVLLFSTSVLFSTVFSRPLTAAAAAVATSLVVLSGIFLQWSVLSLVPRFESQWLALEVTGVALLILATSCLLFARAELINVSAAPFVTSVTAMVGLGVVAVGFLPMLPARHLLAVDEAVVDGSSISVGGGSVAFEVTDASGGRRQIWAAHSAGGGLTRLTGRRALSPHFDCWRWATYYSRRGLFGGAAQVYELRAVAQDGTSDHRVVGGLAEPVEFVFAPDDYTRLALLAGRELVLARLGLGVERRIDVGGTPLEGARLLGWTEAFADELLFVRPADAGFTVGAHDLATGETRVLLEGAGEIVPPVQRRRRSGWRRFPLQNLRSDGAPRLALLDVSTGETETLTETACGRTDVDDTMQLLVWVECGLADGASFADIHLRDLVTDEDRLLARLEADEVVFLELSPGERHLALRARRRNGRARALLVNTSDGATIELDPSWHARGWLFADRLLVVDDPDRPTRLAAATVGGAVHHLYP